MNNEPVAWTSQDVLDADHIIKAVVRREQDEQHTIPLYTHPAKTLTDGEYDNIFANGKRLGVLETEDKFRKAMNLTDEEIITVLTDKFVKDQGRYASTNLFYIEFARAILKKAGELAVFAHIGFGKGVCQINDPIVVLG